MKKSKAFTLIELLIVMAVIAVLIGIAIPSFRGMQQEANKTKASGDLRDLKMAIESYYKNHSYKYPASGVTWQDALTGAAPQIVTSTLQDPFNSGITYSYTLSAGTQTSNYYLIYSVGSGTAGTATITAAGIVTTTSNAIFDTNGHT